MLRNTFCTLESFIYLISYLFSVENIGTSIWYNRLAFFFIPHSFIRWQKSKSKKKHRKERESLIVDCERETDLLGSSFFYCLLRIIYII